MFFSPKTLAAALLVLAGFAIIGCASRGPEVAAPAVAPPPPPAVVARVNGEPIPESELLRYIEGDMEQMEREHQKKLFELKKTYTSYLIDSHLLREEAARRGITPGELLKLEVEEKSKDVSDEELRALYDRYSAQLDQPFEEVRDRIVEYRVNERKQELRQSFFRNLRENAKIEVLLEYPEVPVVDLEGGASGPSMGPETAKVTIVTFSDFQCPYCSRMVEPMKELLEEYPGQVRLVYRHFPLDIHPQARLAAEASECVEEQGRFWEFHDLVFEHQAELAEEGKIQELASSAGVDVEAFTTCLDEGRYSERVSEDLRAGRDAGVQGTPAFFVNGRPIYGAESLDVFRAMIQRELGNAQG